ncbi:JmjC-domain-containing protein, partial [Clavulina sp. PMI_390]
MEEFADFEAYITRVDPWGRRSGIVKIIPPKEWSVSDSLPPTKPLMPGVVLHSPIEQVMMGGQGLFRQQNIERRKKMSIMDWSQHNDDNDGLDLSELTTEQAAFYSSFKPQSSWLPPDTQPSDYTPAACRELERSFWRSCGIVKPAWYGADMAGSLFSDPHTPWNVARLPSFLSRLTQGRPISGVNTPYLYFGMWRATFAWHVEDMDLYSINYIHWGAPKFWYAIPSEKARTFENTMRNYFPGDRSQCPQFLRHKSYLASPSVLSPSCRPNTLVQHQGEFVVTFPNGYHAGFNLGLNCAESTNFALESWVQLGRTAGVCRCVDD